ncbi:MAG: ABC transporter substrate-binding protein [Elusimicrobia bacterium]|nr:ABC transporter substrate-binding protein [Elusimicrobiota bacterium]
MKLLRAASFCLAAFALGAPLHGAAVDRASTLIVADDVADPSTLDPQKLFVEKAFTLVQQIFDGLARIDPDGKIVPALATHWRWIDDTTLELELRRGVKFHDGEPFDANAVKFTIERYLDPKTGFPAVGYLNSIKSVEIVDPYTVRIKTRYPDGILLNRLAGFVHISPPVYIAKVGDAQFGEHPVGTGAFRFVSWEKGKSVVLDANENYWSPGRPKFKRLIFRFLSPARQVDELLRGGVDIVTELPGTETLRVMKSGVANIVKKESYYTVAGSINISSGPLADLRVRQALNYALDKEELIRYDLLGNGRPIATTTMEGETGHDPSLRPYPYDLRKARALLKAAGYPKGIDLKVIIKYQTERSAKIMTKQLARAGIRLEIHKSPDSSLSRDIQAGGWDFTFGGCPDLFGHAFFIQSIFLYSRSPFSLLKSPDYDARLIRMISSLDPAEQQRLGMEMDRYLYDQALSLFTYQKIRTYGVRKNVDFVPTITGMPYFYLSSPKL